MGEKNRKVFIVAPGGSSSGGAESLHQLASELKQIGVKSYIYYFNPTKLTVNEKFEKYNVEIVNNIEDTSNNFIIVPEVYTSFLSKYKKVKKVIWWLSKDFYLKSLVETRVKEILDKYRMPSMLNWLGSLIYKFLKPNFIGEFRFGDGKNKIFHLYNCEYIKEYLLENGVHEDNTMYLCGPIGDEYLNTKVNINGKKNIIVYNPAKGLEFTNKIISRFNEINSEVSFIAIENMKPSEIKDLLAEAKLYIDFGFFPGPERIPREAVLMKCNIITSTSGSAANIIDVPIPLEFKFEKSDSNIEAIVLKMRDSLDNYVDHLPKYDFYRNKVKKQREQFIVNIKFISEMVNSI